MIPALSLFLLTLPHLASLPDSLDKQQLTLQQPDSSVTPRVLPGTLTIQTALSQIAGVQATPYSGAPGANVAVRIRGAASLADGARPLYVVDGIPVFQHTFGGAQNTAAFFDESVEGSEESNNPLLSLPPEDIASIEVLKGALETARYGATGQNGVIRITTRRGANGQPLRVQYSGYGGVQQVRRRYELLDAHQYGELVNDVQATAGKPARYSAAELGRLGRGTDWQKEVLRTAAVQEHHVGLDGGTQSTRYYVGTDYLRQSGILLNSQLSRYSGRAGVEQRLGSRVRLEISAGFSQNDERRPAYYTIAEVLSMDPTQPVRDASGAYTRTRFFNPVQLANETYRTPQQQRLLSQAGLFYMLVPGLTLQLRGGLERDHQHYNSYQARDPRFGNYSSVHDATYRQWTLNPGLRYERTLAKRHQVTASAELLTQRMQQDQSTVEKVTYSPNDPNPVTTQNGAIAISSSMFTGGMGAALLSAGYAFDKRYELQGSLRQDVVSSFSSDQRKFWLPGLQATWHAGREGFLASHASVSRLDAWLGWGQTSNNNHFGQSGVRVPVASQNGPGVIVLFLPERTTQLETGAYLGLLGGRLDLTAVVYQRQTKNAAYQFSRLPEYSLRNRGLELTASAQWKAGPVGGFTTLAASTNQSHMSSNFYSYGSFQRVLANQPLSAFYGPNYQGVNINGSPRYQDMNADGRIDYQDQQYLGSGLPRQLASLQQQLVWHRFTLDAQLQGMFGYKIQNAVLQLLDSPTDINNASTRVLDRWTPAHTATDVPRASNDYVLGNSSYTLQCGDHARLSQLTLSYPVWQRERRTVTAWVGGQNLLVISGYRGFDPNVSSGGFDNKRAGLDVSAYPTARTVLFGVKATM